MHILHNNAWWGLCQVAPALPFDDTNAQDAKIMAREAGRLRMSLQAGGGCTENCGFLHYPPVYILPAVRTSRCGYPGMGRVQQCHYAPAGEESTSAAIQREVDWHPLQAEVFGGRVLHFCPYKQIYDAAFVCSFFTLPVRGIFISKMAGILCRYMV